MIFSQNLSFMSKHMHGQGQTSMSLSWTPQLTYTEVKMRSIIA